MIKNQEVDLLVIKLFDTFDLEDLKINLANKELY